MADLSLLFQLRADNAQAKATMADTRAAVTQLRQQFGKDLSGMQGIARSAIADIGENINAFVGQRIPLIGGAFVRVTSNLKGFNDELRRGGPQTEKLAQQIDAIAKASGKSTTEVSRFLTTFVRLQGQSARNEAAFKTFGGSVDLIGNKTANLLPQLDEAGETLAVVAAEAGSTGAAMASMAGPIAIAVAALAAQVVIVVTLTKEIFNLAKASADYQGKLFDLSQQVGVSVETLSALEVVARTTGGSIDSLVQSLGIFQRHLEEAVEDRGSKAAKTFRQLGVDATDTESALRQTIAALARMPEGFRQTALALEVFGRGGKAFLAIAKEANGDIDEITRRLKDLGLVTTDQAKLADEFNDQLVLLQVQLRGLGTQAIPVVLDVLRDLSELLKENRELFNLLGALVKAQAVILATAFRGIKIELDKIQVVLEATALFFERIKAAIEFIAGHPIKFPFSGAPEPTTAAAPAQPEAADIFTQQLQDRIDAQKRLQNVLNSAFAEQQRNAQDSIALAQREFEAGKRNRQQLLDATIEGTRKQTKAEIDALEVERAIKLKEQALAKDDLEKKNQLATAIFAIDTQIANKRAEQRRNEANLRAQARRDEQQSELAHQQAQLDILTRLGADRIAAIEDQIRQELVARDIGLEEIEKIENAALVARGQLLKRELEIAGVGPDRQVVLDKIKALEADRTELERRQSQRRREITQEEFESKRQIILSNLDAILQIEQIRGNARIATIKALADLGVKTEEQAAREILKVRLGLLDAEEKAIEARQKAAAGITDPKARREAENDLLNQLKILNAEREALQAEGNRDIERGRQQDLENERRYARELQSIRERINDIQRETARTVIDLMILNHARRKDIIRAQTDLELKDEQDRHQREIDNLERQRQENAASKKTAEEKLEVEKELNRQREAEAERHQLTLEEIEARRKKALALASPFGGFAFGLESGQLKELEAGVKSFADVATVAFSAVGAVVNQLAQGVGSLVQQWVLLGSTGPGAFRKLVASVLAGVAAQAATLAIMELAYGVAALTPWGAAVYGPAAAHFKAAALFGSVAAVAGVAGRGVAGDLFKSTGGAGAGGASASGPPQPLQTIVQNRNQQQERPIILHVDVRHEEGVIVKTWADDFGNGGITRQVVDKDGR